jgi:starvation-inducible outer membrane lipoprotein
MKKTITILLIALFALTACTENQRAKRFGATANIKFSCGKKLVNVTFKKDNLWMLTRELTPTDTVESYEFNEDSSWGIFEGTVKIQECRKDQLNDIPKGEFRIK